MGAIADNVRRVPEAAEGNLGERSEQHTRSLVARIGRDDIAIRSLFPLVFIIYPLQMIP